MAEGSTPRDDNELAMDLSAKKEAEMADLERAEYCETREDEATADALDADADYHRWTVSDA
jgi:hypothetical protein